ncbi:MAG TPA: magnesium transporter, partial [Phycisphaerae bacterium]|nr:magnesium transporter [Phycisphaerae bacterium]
MLVLFLPLIISSGGNTGSQASTLVIRSMALGELTLGSWWRILRREVLVGVSLGLVLGTIGVARVLLWG